MSNDEDLTNPSLEALESAGCSPEFIEAYVHFQCLPIGTNLRNAWVKTGPNAWKPTHTLADSGALVLWGVRPPAED